MDEKQKQHLQKHGWVVIPNVIAKEKCKKVVDCIETFLCDNTFPDPWNWFKVIPKEVHHGGMCNTFGHFQELWDVRQDPKLAQIWADYYKINPVDLLVSMDRWSYYYAPAMNVDAREKDRK
jgi:hypothetical protein